MTKELLDYFKNDELAASTWLSKYCLKNNQGKEVESTPCDMHYRMAKEFARKQEEWVKNDYRENYKDLSKFGENFFNIHIKHFNRNSFIEVLMHYFDNFKYIVPQGSIMSMLGNTYKIGSLSNCFTVASPVDSYGGIMQTDQHLVQLMKRRAGVGTNLDLLRPSKTLVSNAAGTSTGAFSFAERFSNTTREVAQDGRRGK